MNLLHIREDRKGPGDQCPDKDGSFLPKGQMGHHSIQITVDTYGHLVPGANREAVNRLGEMGENPQPIRSQPQ